MSRAASLPGAELFPRNRTFFEQATCPGQLRCLGQIFFSKNGLSGILGLLCTEQDVGNLKKCTFKNSGTPVRRTRRRTSQPMHFQEFWDSCAQNKTSEISNKCTFRKYGTPVRRTRRRKSQKNGLSGILGLLRAGQTSEISHTWTFRSFGAPVRRTKRRKSSKTNFLEFWDSCALNKTSYISKTVL